MSTTNQVPETQNLLNMETGKFIQTIQEHMDEGLTTGFDRITPQLLTVNKQDSSRLDLAKKELKQLGVVAESYPLDVSVMQAYERQTKNLTLLPEINGPIKSVRKLLMQDLEADGVIKRNIPYSSRRSKDVRMSPSPSN